MKNYQLIFKQMNYLEKEDSFVCVRYVTRNGKTYDAWDYGHKCWPIQGYRTQSRQHKLKKKALIKTNALFLKTSNLLKQR